jgi:transcriptional regulator with XRE-family HTH domain
LHVYQLDSVKYAGSRFGADSHAWLDWTRKALADKAGVGLETVQAIERGYSDPRKSTLDKLERAFREAGIVFIDEGDAGGPGIRKIS